MNKARISVTIGFMLCLMSTLVLSDVKVGAPFALSGSVAELAADMKRGAELAVAQVNEQGGVLGQPLTFIYADSACNPDRAVEVVTQLIEQEEVSALVGPVCSGATLRQARSVSIPAGVATLSVASASFLITKLRDKDLVFRTATSDAFKGKAMAQLAWQNGTRDIAVSFASDAYNTSVAKVFTQAFEALGGQVTVNQAHQPEQDSYKREADALMTGSKNLALFAYYGSSGTQLLSDVVALDQTGAIYAADGMLTQDLIDTLGADALKNTSIVGNAADESREAFERWKAIADAASLPAAGAFVANSYDAAFMMALAIEAVGSASREDIPKGLRAISGPEGETIYPGEFEKAVSILKSGGTINYEGGSGPVDFDEHGDVTGFVSVSTVVNDQWDAQLLK